MKRPTQEQIDVAVLWLRSNEGEGDEAAACRAVADWIDHEANEAFIRSEARRAGVTTARLRRALQDRVKGEIA